jgi:hypothetical protein
MNHNKNKEKASPMRPFFARFLEQQDLEKVSAGNNEDHRTTLKYPSDSEDSGL